MSGRIQALDQELKKLTEIVLRLAPLAQQEMLNYRVLETQHSQLSERNTLLARQNVEAEERMKKAVETADMIIAEARKEEQTIKASLNTLYVKAQVKYKELEKNLDDADRSAIKKSLKQFEQAVAA